jgi:predicted alpha/beta superfamily hydrolase
VDEALDALDAMNLADEVLVVAVWATPERREAEYMPPGWSAYADDLVLRLKPAIDGRFRTLEGPATTAVMGSSLGGLVSLYLAWEHPDVFGAAACLSSTFWKAPEWVERLWTEPRRPIRVYLDSGWPGDNHESTREVRDALVEAGYVMGRDLLHLAFPGALHHERAWAARVHLPFQFLFGDAFGPRSTTGPGFPLVGSEGSG